MAALFSELFRAFRREAPAPGPKPAKAEAPAPARALTPFDAVAEKLGWNRPDDVLVTLEEAEREAALVEQVRAHFHTNPPPPTSLPPMAMQVISAVARPDVSFPELTRLIAQDPGLTAGVVRVANSPVFAGAQQVDTLREAVTRLGLSEVGRVAGMVAARALFQPLARTEQGLFPQRWQQLFSESVVTARSGAALAMRVRGARADHVFLAGLLHDVGRTAALRSVALLQMSGAFDPLPVEVLDRVLEAVHVDLGGACHQAWELPRLATLVAVRHHDRGLPADGEYVDVHVVRLMSALGQLEAHRWKYEEVRAEVDESCAALRLDGFALRAAWTQLTEERKTVARMLATA